MPKSVFQTRVSVETDELGRIAGESLLYIEEVFGMSNTSDSASRIVAVLASSAYVVAVPVADLGNTR